MKNLWPCLLFTSSIVLIMPIEQSTIAGQVKPRLATCYFFQGEKLAIKESCTFESYSWAGGGGSTLTWKDGIKTQHAWGLQGRGERVCPEGEESIDRVCGKSYARQPKTLKTLSAIESTQLKSRPIHCVQLKQKSVCWMQQSDRP
jgi:hypothetical protein